jgi:hypothetical protein
MSFKSILFTNAHENRAASTNKRPDFFSDLNLDQIIERVTKGKDAYNLEPFFFLPLRDLDAINYRQEIAQDLDGNRVLQNIRSFSEKMLQMRRYLGMAEKSHYKYYKEGWFLEAVKIYCEAVTCLVEDLRVADLESRGLMAFRDYIIDYANSSQFTSLLKETNKLKTDLSSVRYCILINGRNVRVRKYEDETDYSIVVSQTFEKFRREAVKDYTTNFPGVVEMNHVEANILELVAKLYPEIFSTVRRRSPLQLTLSLLRHCFAQAQL